MALDLIAGAIDDRTARGIAAAVGRLVTAGTLPAGTRLPTVRDVAKELGISPTTVSEAWRSLARAGAIQTRGRSGTFVSGPSVPRQRLRYAQLGGRVSELGGGLVRDYSTGVPDYDLLPSLSEALRRIGDARLTTSYLDGAVLPRLEAVLRARWPFLPEQLTVVDGALDALDRITGVVVRFGDHVLVEDPAFPPVLDLLETVGATVVGVPIDEHGLRPEALAAALRSVDPVAVYLQPRAHNPTGASMTQARADKLARVLAKHPSVTIVEDDHSGGIATAAPVSLGRRLPDRTVHVVSFSKSHGPDLRLAAIGGPADVVTAVTDRRLLGPGWSSRLLQAVLVDLLTDPSTVEQIAHAREEYARRRTALLDALDARGVTATAGDGINLWMAVANQQVAMLTLAAHGIAVAPGAPFEVSHLDSDHVRVTVGLVREGFEELADVLAEAAGTPLRGSGPRTATHPRGWR
ncbi:PLP-dependent aminotransferase family protein [Dactylosporangium sucinum]|uniref:GntR family transcriptional regulator n=1 Tax=Dactylosporangium sucinum TaxID=1424081 RepID=A0A917WJG8_9ACTN|nr:aminotransferase class I/II-fold pyridoxal phosphate-dependent enzyme [Dactylosporangium sucinum]GGM08644.1 GntR family transcriptional regulator [Dactylosporangium sucinum]